MYRSIVVGTDGSQSARNAMHHAAELAKLSGAPLHLVSAFRNVDGWSAPGAAPSVSPISGGDPRTVVESMLDEAADDLRRQGITVHTYAYPGSPADAIVEIAEVHDCDLIVVGNRGMKGARRLLGTVPNSVSHNAPCSVLIVNTT